MLQVRLESRGNAFLRGRAGDTLRCQRKVPPTVGQGSGGEIEKVRNRRGRDAEKSPAALTRSGEVRPFVSRIQTSFCNCKFSTPAPRNEMPNNDDVSWEEVKYCGSRAEALRRNVAPCYFGVADINHGRLIATRAANSWGFVKLKFILEGPMGLFSSLN